jgi:hypothetical protein
MRVTTWNLDLVQKHGALSGPTRGMASFVLTELLGEPVAGTFELQAHGRSSGPPPAHTGRFTGRGTGDLAGMTIRGTFALVGPDEFDLEGYIVIPR